MGRARRPIGLIMCRKRRRTAIYKRMPTMYKKAMELNENCGVNVTLVTENEGIYRFYNTSNKSMREVFEGYLQVLQNSPQSFSTEEPVPDDGHGPAPDPRSTAGSDGACGKAMAAIDVCEPDSLLRLFDAAVDIQKTKDSAKRKAARKLARSLQRLENSRLVTTPLTVSQKSPPASLQTAVGEVVAVSNANLVGKAVVPRSNAELKAPKNTKSESVTMPLASSGHPTHYVGPFEQCLGEDGEAVTVEKKKKKRIRDAEVPMPCADTVIPELPKEKVRAFLQSHTEDVVRGKDIDENDCMTPKIKKKKKQRSPDQVNMVDILGASTKSATITPASTAFTDEEDISVWLDGVEEMSMTSNGPSCGILTGQSDPIFARFKRS